jgi:hypothetical protein
MNVSIALLLSSYPDGRASYASLKSDLAMLSTPEWLARMRALGARAGSINIFSEKFATRDGFGWTITQAGRVFLKRLENGEEPPSATIAAPAALRVVSSTSPVARTASTKQARLKVVGLA